MGVLAAVCVVTVYVDALTEYPQEMRDRARSRTVSRIPAWSHLWADTLDELHAMADRIGAKRSWFQPHPRHPHYDIARRLREAAVKAGAIEMSYKEWLRRRMTA